MSVVDLCRLPLKNTPRPYGPGVFYLCLVEHNDFHRMCFIDRNQLDTFGRYSSFSNCFLYDFTHLFFETFNVCHFWNFLKQSGRTPWLPVWSGLTQPTGLTKSGSPRGLGLSALIPTSLLMFAI